MDLSQFDLTPMANEGAVMTVCHPISGEKMTFGPDKKPVTILLLGAESDAFREATKIQARKQLKGSKGINLDAALESAAHVLAAVTMGWDGLQENGVDIPFSTEKAVEIYTKYQWLRQQADAFVSDRENFFKA